MQICENNINIAGFCNYTIFSLCVFPCSLIPPSLYFFLLFLPPPSDSPEIILPLSFSLSLSLIFENLLIIRERRTCANEGESYVADDRYCYFVALIPSATLARSGEVS